MRNVLHNEDLMSLPFCSGARFYGMFFFPFPFGIFLWFVQLKSCKKTDFNCHCEMLLINSPAGIFDSGSVLLNQNVNGCVHTYVNHSRMVAERWPNGSSHKIGSELVQDWFGRRSVPAGSIVFIIIWPFSCVAKQGDLEVNGHRCWLSQCGGKPRWSQCKSSSDCANWYLAGLNLACVLQVRSFKTNWFLFMKNWNINDKIKLTTPVFFLKLKSDFINRYCFWLKSLQHRIS